MKHLGLSSAATVNRFRLTFDDTSDVAANRNIELHQRVDDCVLSVRRPPCTREEPKCTRADSSVQLQDSNVFISCGDNKSSASDIIGSSSTVSEAELRYVCSSKSVLASAEDSSPTAHLFLPDGQTCACSFSATSEPLLPSASYNNSSTKLQQLNDESGPKVTICISNSQQSFLPYVSDSSVSDKVSYDQSQLNHFHHANTNNCLKTYPDVESEEACTNFLHNENCRHFDFPEDFTNSLTSPELDQDTVSAPPIQDLYRYHVFFSNCPEDREWVEHVVAHLEAPPFNYTCAYASLQDEIDPGSLQQRILCASMLSERVVLVLSRRYVEETWSLFEKTLKRLTQMSLHNQRIMGVLLEDCEIPESLGELYFLDASDPDFFHVFTKRLKTSKFHFLESLINS